MGGVDSWESHCHTKEYSLECFAEKGLRFSEVKIALTNRVKDLHYLGSLPPEFNPHQPAHEARHVVLELDMDEPRGQRLTRTGYYLVAQLSPTEAEALLFPPA
jgi:hypothetical protein